MFEPLPALIRLERQRQKLTVDALSALAGVSRTRLVALEKGDDNISLELLLKITNALGMRELRIGGLTVVPAAPDYKALVAAAEAIELAQSVIEHAKEMSEALERVARPVLEMLNRDRGMATRRSDPSDTPAAASGGEAPEEGAGGKRAGGRG